ncbi:transposase [Ktedonobacter robiniae]|uniref:Tc1-like transposase DDE domain-containing protein n=1 Tax=Ktedonobacter robiniae TaxID=2778365 RepID=A0ABQ3UYX3_9CHLR|nr:transposase [Ktedonobacter robiniae]GHO57988.1 hypothetical protein KSB_64630 [Ktedonobacter robiniae]
MRKDTPAGSVIVDIDEMGPVAAKSYPGQEAVNINVRPAQRAKQEIDYGRRAKGYVYGALREATGECFTQCYPRRCLLHFIDFLCEVNDWLDASIERIYAVLDNLDMHHCRDLLLFQIHHSRWEFVYQPSRAAYLNLIEPWWKTLRSLALKGRRFETWEEVMRAVEAATAYWNAHKHPFGWGRRRRHQPLRQSHTFSCQVKVMRI